MKFKYNDKWVEVSCGKKRDESTEDGTVYFAIFDGKEEKYNSLSLAESLEFARRLDTKETIISKYVSLSFAKADDKRPDRFGITIGGKVAPISMQDAAVLSLYLKESVKHLINLEITTTTEANNIIDDAFGYGGENPPSEESFEEGETPEEAMEKYPVTDVRNPLNLKYKGK